MFRIGQKLVQPRVFGVRFASYSHNYDEIVNAKKCVVFMKGTPDSPQVRSNFNP